MYDYRSMTAEERAQVLQVRRARGFPLHAPPHFNHDGDFLITAACFEHVHVFDDPELLTWLSAEILELCASIGFICLAWVFLPNHYHALLRVAELKMVSEGLRKKHSQIATKINSRQQQRGRQVWYRFTDRCIRTEGHFWATINYLHNNPVKHGYVDDPRKWPWSSFPDYLNKFGGEWMDNIGRLYPVMDYGKGWDDR